MSGNPANHRAPPYPSSPPPLLLTSPPRSYSTDSPFSPTSPRRPPPGCRRPQCGSLPPLPHHGLGCTLAVLHQTPPGNPAGAYAFPPAPPLPAARRSSGPTCSTSPRSWSSWTTLLILLSGSRRGASRSSTCTTTRRWW
ncbi:hypothetical protein PHJA_002592000 [Phtheirospermum japonicum]|uniref:Uncharacterized protein n=1 Tax=Phtheirospermum japonicum TaxID=374723 RepID=A0A830CX49_9LAMI|nr:hypothetical protein PHJA_002592000 [Phtheirospermum japonicum]